MAKMVGGAVLFVAILVLLGALVAGAIQYWPITLLAIGGIVGGYVGLNKWRDKRNEV
ncbi:MAG: hypothetical protein HY216_11010 [Candidatus Rokubacteria bacterium]|jgi:hypothetical protein|nr:hypothetical protein [Candidatus Rokubacteria bacterium]